MLKFYVRLGMIVDINHETISFKQNMWLGKNKTFNTQKRKKSNNDFERNFCNLLNNAFYGKTTENVRNRWGLEFIK